MLDISLSFASVLSNGMKILILIICCLTLFPLTANAYQTKDAYGNYVDSESSYQAKDAHGNYVNSKDSYQAKDAYGNYVNSRDRYQTKDAYGNYVQHEAVEEAPNMIDSPYSAHSSDEEPGWGEEDQDE